jgi:hypothetical protein
MVKSYEVDWFVNGEKAYKSFVRGHYDLCILDIMMPVRRFYFARNTYGESGSTRYFPYREIDEGGYYESFKPAQMIISQALSTWRIAWLRRFSGEQGKTEKINLNEYKIGNYIFYPNTQMLKTEILT